jgi:VWFA-related protein
MMLSASFLAAFFGLLNPCTLSAQSAPPSGQQAPTLRVSTRLVQVHVIIQDKKGKPVRGLAKEDFTLVDQGRPQRITFFSEQSGDLRAAVQSLPPDTFSNRYEQTGQATGSVTVILLDALNTPFGDYAYAKQTAIKLVHGLNPDDHVAIYFLGIKLNVIQDFTQDSTALLHALEQHKHYAAEEHTDDPFGEEWDAAYGINGWDAKVDALKKIGRAQLTAQAITAIANHLASIPGRKNLVWMSADFPVSAGLTRVLNQADMAIYPIDPRGLMSAPYFNVTKGHTSQLGGQAPQTLPTDSSTLSPALDSDTMNKLADGTGGRASYNSNDAESSVRQAIDDGHIVYVLGYYPNHGKWDGKFHEISVKVDRRDVQVRSRKGYFAEPEGPPGQQEMHATIQEALMSPLDSTGLGLNVRVEPGLEKGQAIFRINVDAHGIRFEEGVGYRKGDLEILFCQLDAKGNRLNPIAGHLPLNFSMGAYDSAMDEGIKLVKQLAIAPQAVTLKVLVRDTASGVMGTVSVPVKNIAQVITETK